MADDVYEPQIVRAASTPGGKLRGRTIWHTINGERVQQRVLPNGDNIFRERFGRRGVTITAAELYLLAKRLKHGQLFPEKLGGALSHEKEPCPGDDISAERLRLGSGGASDSHARPGRQNPYALPKVSRPLAGVDHDRSEREPESGGVW